MMTQKLLLLAVAICLVGLPNVVFAQSGNQFCTPGFAGGETCVDTESGDTTDIVGGLVGDHIDEGLGNLITDHGDLAYGLFKDFSLGNLLETGCTAVTDAVENDEEDNEEDQEANEEESESEEDGGGINVSTEDAQSALCFANEGYKVIDDFNSQMPLVLEKWGENLFSDALQYDLGLGEYLTREEIDAFSADVGLVITGKDADGNKLELEDRIAQLSSGEASRKIVDATREKMKAQEEREKNAPPGTVEGNWQEAIAANPNLAAIDNQASLQELRNVEKSAQSFENSLLSSEIATLGGEKTEVIQETGEKLEEYGDFKGQQLQTAPSSRAALFHNGKTLVDAMTFSNVTQQQISAQLGLSLRNDAIMTSQVGVLAEAETQKATKELNSSRGILENAVNQKLDTYDSLGKGMTGVSGSIARLSDVKDEEGQRIIGGGDGIVGNGLF